MRPTVRAELVEAPFFLKKKARGFDRLSPNGVNP